MESRASSYLKSENNLFYIGHYDCNFSKWKIDNENIIHLYNIKLDSYMCEYNQKPGRDPIKKIYRLGDEKFILGTDEGKVIYLDAMLPKSAKILYSSRSPIEHIQEDETGLIVIVDSETVQFYDTNKNKIVNHINLYNQPWKDGVIQDSLGISLLAIMKVLKINDNELVLYTLNNLYFRVNIKEKRVVLTDQINTPFYFSNDYLHPLYDKEKNKLIFYRFKENFITTYCFNSNEYGKVLYMPEKNRLDNYIFYTDSKIIRFVTDGELFRTKGYLEVFDESVLGSCE